MKASILPATMLLSVLTYACSSAHEGDFAAQFQKAATLHESGEYYAAMQACMSALKAAEEAGNDLQMSDANALLGSVHQDLAQYAEAERHYYKALEQLASSKSLDQPRQIRLLNNLGTLFDDLGNYKKAEAYHKEAFDTFISSGLKSDSMLVSCLNNIAVLRHHQGKLADAVDFYKMALKVLQASEEDQPHIAGFYNNLALIQMEQNKLDESAKSFQVAEELVRSKLGTDHLLYARYLGNHTKLLVCLKKLDEAESECKEAVRTSLVALGEHHPQTATCYKTMGKVLILSGRVQEGELYFLKAADITEKIYQTGAHPRIAEVYAELAELEASSKDYAKADEHFLRACTAYQSVFPGLSHPRAAAVFQQYLTMLRATGRDAKAEELQRKLKK